MELGIERGISIAMMALATLACFTTTHIMVKYLKLQKRMVRVRDSLMELWYASTPENKDHPKVLPPAREHARKVLRMETRDPETVPDLQKPIT